MKSGEEMLVQTKTLSPRALSQQCVKDARISEMFTSQRPVRVFVQAWRDATNARLPPIRVIQRSTQDGLDFLGKGSIHDVSSTFYFENY